MDRLRNTGPTFPVSHRSCIPHLASHLHPSSPSFLLTCIHPLPNPCNFREKSLKRKNETFRDSVFPTLKKSVQPEPFSYAVGAVSEPWCAVVQPETFPYAVGAVSEPCCAMVQPGQVLPPGHQVQQWHLCQQSEVPKFS